MSSNRKVSRRRRRSGNDRLRRDDRGRSGGRRTSRGGRERAKNMRASRFREIAVSPRENNDDAGRKESLHARRPIRKSERFDDRRKERGRPFRLDHSHPRVFSTSNESGAESAAGPSDMPRVFLPNEYLENETGFWQKQLDSNQAAVTDMDKRLTTKDKRMPVHVLDNLAYTPITSESLRGRGLQLREVWKTFPTLIR